jgi:hypothetical protein
LRAGFSLTADWERSAENVFSSADFESACKSTEESLGVSVAAIGSGLIKDQVNELVRFDIMDMRGRASSTSVLRNTLHRLIPCGRTNSALGVQVRTTNLPVLFGNRKVPRVFYQYRRTASVFILCDS